MKAVVLLVGLCATCTFAAKKYPQTCPAVIFKAKSGKVRDGANYVNGIASTANDVLYISDLTGKGVATVRVPANKNNIAADIIIKDGLMIIEAGAEYAVPNMVKDCGVDGICTPALDLKRTYFDYAKNSPVSCGQKKCDKTCNKQTCDYWGEEEEYSCKSLEDEYGCDCFGCKCEVDHQPCSSKLAKKTCNGKTCDEWTASSGISCEILEKDLGCSCIGCSCKKPPVCDAKAQKVCSDAYKVPCKIGKKGATGVKCGKCQTGYVSNGKGDCDKGQQPKDSCGNEMKKDCGKKDYVGDGYCDDENNNAGCGWDKGDCCGTTSIGKDKQMSYCKKCKCLDCNYKKKGDKCIDNIKGHCGAKEYKGDGNCDDNNNNAGCAWDGGDCCGKDVKKSYCKECKCRDCTAAAPPGDTCVKSAKQTCKLKDYKGDGNCDDGNNNAGCAWDGGDCCKEKIVKTYCKKCECLDCTKQKSCPKKGKNCGNGQYKGDGNCDDENNLCACDWDGGDCCGTSVKKTYCKQCKCLDPKYKKPACGAPDYVGDGNCDDENNNESCNYDKGDCCGPKVVKTYCKVCKCIDPKYKAPSCGAPEYQGDGNCDDENNNKSCNYDNGDCCGVVKKNYCKICKCLDPNYKPSCGSPQYKGDGNCDDENNNKSCEFDGGDCCGGSVVKTYCKVCKCLDPKNQFDPNCQGSCGAKDYVNDGNCDDENNNCACKYDGGDCCAKTNKNKKVGTTYCKDCSCVDPKQTSKCNGTCKDKSLQGDGFCDDENNVCGCQYDGGDCCLGKKKKVNKTYCKKCHCINPKKS